jgi:hypothetical protein
MTNTQLQDRLYGLLPAVYRLRDSDQGEPLRALLSLIEQEFDALELDILGLYENWFIETCQEWVVPYIGDLLDVRPLYPVSPGTFSERAYVAHTLDYRRRKGTASMLEQLAVDVTGWPARVVEFFQLLDTTQYLNHLRPQNVITPDLRDTNSVELLGGPFESIAHTVDVRHINDGRGKYNIPNIGIFLWRLEDFLIGPISEIKTGPTRQSDARAVVTPSDGRHTFDPLGGNAPLFNRPQTKTTPTQRTQEINVPGPLRRRLLYDELEALRKAEVDGLTLPTPVYFGANPVFEIAVNGAMVPFDEIMICDISDVSATDWRRPLSTKTYQPAGGGLPVNKLIALSVDPVRGRIAFPTGITPLSVEVEYTYGFSGEVGAGPYDRTQWLSDPALAPGPFNNPKRKFQVGVSQELTPVANVIFATLAEAVQAWHAQPAGTDGIITILDSRTYTENLSGTDAIVVPEGSRLLMVAADWPAQRDTPPPASLVLDPNGLRPHLLGDLSVRGTAPALSQTPGELYIDGLLIEGAVNVLVGNLGKLGISHSTVAPSESLSVVSSGAPGGANDGLTVNLYRTICGPISLSVNVPVLNTTDSIVTSGPASADNAPAIDAAGAILSIQTTTVFGATGGRIISAGNSIFTGVVTAQRQQTGCVRFCYVPAGSTTAPRYHCQPDLALNGITDPGTQNAIRARLEPQFTSIDFGQPGYAQLSLRCAKEITTGAEDGSEMGVFNFLRQPQRKTNLLTALGEYLRFGLEAGLIEET